GCLHLTCDIPMLRALAKVEVIDNIGNAGAISGVTMTQYNTIGRYIPNIADNPNWNTYNTQIEKPSLPNGANGMTGSNLLFVNIPTTMNENGVTVTRNVWTAYIPEMQLGTTQTIEANRPRLNVAVDNGSTYPLHFAQYDANSVPSLPNNTSWNYILRNHIYRYTINSINITANLTVNVLPWTIDEDTPWDYIDNVIIEEGNFLEWDENTVLADDKTNATVTLNANTTDIAVATFKISAPRGGRWYVSLLPLEGREDAFMLVDENDEEITSLSGDIGTQGYIRIKNRYATVNDRNNRAKLVIMVETIDGRWMEADLCDGTPTNYTIIQNITNL
ncbi:MAG: hypothetical protein J1F25_06465, partial [Prevotellaceae bacterium]|nr:hypothetical protein [Prevotellaceae bacterium]